MNIISDIIMIFLCGGLLGVITYLFLEDIDNLFKRN